MSRKAAFPDPRETNFCFTILPSLSRKASASTHGRGDGLGAPTLTTLNRRVWPEAIPTMPELKSGEATATGALPCAAACSITGLLQMPIVIAQVTAKFPNREYL